MELSTLRSYASMPVDEETRAVIQAAQAAARRGEVFTEEEVEAELDAVYEEWQKQQSSPQNQK